MNELSLFTGAGGGLLGTRLLGWRPVGYVEWDAYCQQVIAARIRDGYLPVAPIFTDVREFIQSGAAAEYWGVADVVTAGFPCQPFSRPGQQRGAGDERNMWPATRDVIRDARPEYALLENVTGLLAFDYFGTIIADLAEMGYVGSYGCLSAASQGLPHRRERVFIVAHSVGDGRPSSAVPLQKFFPGERACISNRVRDSLISEEDYAVNVRNTDVVAGWMDRLKAIGNGQVPRVVRRAWELLS